MVSVTVWQKLTKRTVYCWSCADGYLPQRIHVDRREINDASPDLHDIVTLTTFVCQPFVGIIEEASVVFIMPGAQRNILWVCVCVHVFVCGRRWGGGLCCTASALHANLPPSSHLLLSNHSILQHNLTTFTVGWKWVLFHDSQLKIII